MTHYKERRKCLLVYLEKLDPSMRLTYKINRYSPGGYKILILGWESQINKGVGSAHFVFGFVL